jgi:excisionase family DNA binding protein
MAMQMIEDDVLLTFKEAMGYLRVSRSTLYRLMWAGQITGHKVGSTWRFYREDLRACVGRDIQVNSMPAHLAMN